MVGGALPFFDPPVSNTFYSSISAFLELNTVSILSRSFCSDASMDLPFRTKYPMNTVATKTIMKTITHAATAVRYEDIRSASVTTVLGTFLSTILMVGATGSVLANTKGASGRQTVVNVN